MNIPATSLFMILTLALASFMFASDGSQAQDFFPKEFAKGDLAQQPANSNASRDEPSKQGTGVPSRLKIGEETNQTAQTDSRQPRLFVLVNSSNKEHFESVVAKVISLAKTGKFKVMLVTHIGDYRNVSLASKRELSELGIYLIAKQSIPNNLPISRSPAWGVMTSSGTSGVNAYVIQGYLEPELFFNQAGQFEIPAGMKVKDDTFQVEALQGF